MPGTSEPLSAGSNRMRAYVRPLPDWDLPYLERLTVDASARLELPLAFRLLPAQTRILLADVHAFARFVESVGLRAPGNRLELLERVELDLRAAASGTARLSAVRALARPLACGRLTLQPVLDLVEAGRRSQTVTSYATFEDVLNYCRFSAGALGRVELQLAGSDSESNTSRCNDVYGALEILRHCRDVAADASKGRCYLPVEELRAAGVTESELAGGVVSAALCDVVGRQVERAEHLLRTAGESLIADLHGWERVTMAGHVAEGIASAAALRAAGFDVASGRSVPSRRGAAGRTVPLLVRTATRASRIDPYVAAAYRHCAQLNGSRPDPLAWGIRLLPGDKRRAMWAVHAFVRRVRDIGMSSGPVDGKRRAFDECRAAAAEPSAQDSDKVMVALADSVRRLPIPLEAFGELIDGYELDAEAAGYDTIGELVQHCRRVAGPLARIGLAVLNAGVGVDAGAAGARRGRGTRATTLAEDLGVALELTRILRDVGTNRDDGRVYLPSADRERFGCELASPIGSGTADRKALAELIRYEASHAKGWYGRGMQLLPLLDRRSAACCATIAGTYRELLDRIAADPEVVMRGRPELDLHDTARIGARSLVGLVGRDG